MANEMKKASVEFKGKTYNVEGTPEQIEAAVKQITGFNGEKSAPTAKAPTDNLGRNLMMSGANAVQQVLTPGGSAQDVPGLLSSIIQGGLGRLPTNIANRPMMASMAGMSGVQMASGANATSNIANGQDMFPKESKTLPDLPSPVTETGKKLSTPLEILGGLIGPGQAGIRAVNKIHKVVKESNEIKDVKFAEKVQNSFFELPRKFSQEFGSQIDELEKSNPTQPINLTGAVSDLFDEMKSNSDVARRVALGLKKFGDVETKDLFNKIASGGTQGVSGAVMPDLTLSQSQKILRALKSVPGIESKLSKAGSSFEANETPILMAIHDIREAQLSAFPQFADALSSYAKQITRFKQTRGLFKFGQTIGKIKGSFGDPQVETAVMSLLPKEIVKEIGGVREAVKYVKLGKEIAGKAGVGATLTAGGAGLLYAGKKLFQ